MGAELTRRPRAAASGACPKGHFWYECAASRFVGCCSIDPCVLAAVRCPVANQPVTTASSSTLVLTETASFSSEPVSSALPSSAVSPVALSSGTSSSVATTTAAASLAPSVTAIPPSLISTQSIFIPTQSTVSFTVTFTAPFSSGQSSIPSVSIITSSPSIPRASTLTPPQMSPTATASAATSSSNGPLFTAGVIAVITMGLVALLCAAIALVILLWWRARSSSDSNGDDDEEEAIEMRTDGLCPLKSRRQPSQPRFHAPQQRPDDSDAAASGHVGAPTPTGPEVGFPELVRPFGIRYPADMPSPNGSSLEINAPWSAAATRSASQRSSGATMPATPLSRPVAPWSEGFPTAGGRISDRADSLRNERLLAGTGANANASDVRWSLSELATVSSLRRHSTPSNIYTPGGRQSLPSAQQHAPSRGAQPQCVWRRLSCGLAATGGGSRGITATPMSRPTRANSYGGGGSDDHHSDAATSPVGHRNHHRSSSDNVIMSPLPASNPTRDLRSRSVVSQLSVREHPSLDNEDSSSGGVAADSGDSGDGGSSSRRRRDSDAESVLLTIPVPGYAELEAADCYYELTPPPRRRPQSAEGEEGHQEQQEKQQQPPPPQPQQGVEAGAGVDEGRVSRSSRLSLSGVRQGFVHKGVEKNEKGGEETVAKETYRRSMGDPGERRAEVMKGAVQRCLTP